MSSNTNGSLGLATSSTAGTTSYRRLPDGELISTCTASGTRKYYLTDILGSVVAITNTSGAATAAYSYDPYGGTRTATGTDAAANPIRYIGGYLDTTGLYKLGARYYDPSSSRFTQQDPSGQEANPYTYAADNPTSYVDPRGLDTTCALTPSRNFCATGGETKDESRDMTCYQVGLGGAIVGTILAFIPGAEGAGVYIGAAAGGYAATCVPK